MNEEQLVFAVFYASVLFLLIVMWVFWFTTARPGWIFKYDDEDDDEVDEQVPVEDKQ